MSKRVGGTTKQTKHTRIERASEWEGAIDGAGKLNFLPLTFSTNSVHECPILLECNDGFIFCENTLRIATHMRSAAITCTHRLEWKWWCTDIKRKHCTSRLGRINVRTFHFAENDVITLCEWVCVPVPVHVWVAHGMRSVFLSATEDDARTQPRGVQCALCNVTTIRN